MARNSVTNRDTLRVMRQVPLNELLRRQREKLGLSQQKIADRAGMSKMGISHLESGRSNPSPEAAPAVAAAYELSERDIALAVYGQYFEEEPASTATRKPRLEAAPVA